MKKFWKYFLITILLLLGLVCIAFLYLFFIPGSSLFNVTYISLNESYTSPLYVVAPGGGQLFNTVELNSLNYDVELVPVTNGKGVSVQVEANSFGFVLTKNKNVAIDGKIEGGVLKINVTEPHGFAAKNRSKITLSLPTTYNLNVALNNSKAYTTALGGVKIGNLSYTTKNGDFELKQAEVIGTMNLNLNSAIFKVDAGAVLHNNDVNLKMKSGRLEAKEHSFNYINVLSNQTGSVISARCNRLNSDIKTSGGRVEIEHVETISFVGGDTNIYIQELANGTIKLMRSGNVSIKHATGIVEISSSKGKITIDQADNRTYLTTEDTGDIAVKKAFVYVNAATKYGNIDVEFDENAAHYNQTVLSSDSEPRRFVGSTENGKITLKNVENINIKITKNGRANVYMENVYGNNLIEGGDGNIYVEVKEYGKQEASNGHAHYMLTTSSVSGGVNVNLQSLKLGGYTDRNETVEYVNCDAASFDEVNGAMNGPKYNNTLKVSTQSGGLRIRDTITKNL